MFRFLNDFLSGRRGCGTGALALLSGGEISLLRSVSLSARENRDLSVGSLRALSPPVVMESSWWPCSISSALGDAVPVAFVTMLLCLFFTTSVFSRSKVFGLESC